tara:strand:- start:59 stop:316 length:258 start_codon:yes stop_codon:yes gene_type:complete
MAYIYKTGKSSGKMGTTLSPKGKVRPGGFKGTNPDKEKRILPIMGMEGADKLWTKSGAQEIASQTPFEKDKRRKRIWQSKQHKVS